jgi:hypothetical protein
LLPVIPSLTRKNLQPAIFHSKSRDSVVDVLNRMCTIKHVAEKPLQTKAGERHALPNFSHSRNKPSGAETERSARLGFACGESVGGFAAAGEQSSPPNARPAPGL